MNATEELRRMLDEAGVEWHDDGYATTCTAWSSNGITWYGLWRDGSIELLAHHLTPEQAIAATVGRGTLTAEQVSNATYAHSIHADCADADWQAIADELNDTMGRGTCEAEETETIKCWVKCKDEPSTERMELIHVMECSECGHTYEHVNGDYEFCPRCGRKRVDA